MKPTVAVEIRVTMVRLVDAAATTVPISYLRSVEYLTLTTEYCLARIVGYFCGMC